MTVDSDLATINDIKNGAQTLQEALAAVKTDDRRTHNKAQQMQVDEN